MINTNKIIDSWLVFQTSYGNKKALTLLVKRWHHKLCRQAYWYTKDMNSAKDIVQDSWPVIITKLDSLKDERSFGSWALSIVTRKSIDYLRKNKRENENLQDYYDDNSINHNDNVHSDTTNLISVLRKSIKELPRTSQLILNLFYMEELTIRQISVIMDLPEGTIKSRLFTAREKLKVILKKNNYEN